MSCSLKDIALAAQVSTTAVSKVLNDAPIRVSVRKRAEIRALARTMNYQPNWLGRALNQRRSRTIGIVVPDMSTLFYPELIQNMEVNLFARGYQTLICNSQDNPEEERSQISHLMSRWVDGLLLAPTTGASNLPLLRSIRAKNKPLICIDRYYPKEPFDYVTTDGKTGGRQGIQILARMGASCLYYLGDKHRNQALDDRLNGARDAAARQGLVLKPVLCAHERKAIRKRCCALMQHNPDGFGLFMESNRMLMGVLDAARAGRIVVPRDMPMVGFDPFRAEINTADDIASLRVLEKPLQYLKQDIKALADRTIECLMERINGKEKKQFRITVAATWQGSLKG